MDFFKSILSEDPEPAVSDEPEESETNPRTNPSPEHQEVDRVDDSTPNPNSSDDGGWSFGGLMKTLTTRSESVLETYRRDIKEFGSGLRKETDLFREAASRAVKELPTSIEVGASAIDGVLKSTAEIISHGKDTLLASSDLESDASETHNYSDLSSNSRRYSRFDSQLIAIQRDMRTYCEEPEDSDDYNNWKLGFVLENKKEEVENLIGDNGAMEEIYKRVVPSEVDEHTFWCRFFYRVHKLKQQEDMRAKLVKRSLSIDDEEELTWDVDDEGEEETKELSEPNTLGNKDLPQIGKKENSNEESKRNSGVVDEKEEAKEASEPNTLGNKDLAQIGEKENFGKESKIGNKDLTQIGEKENSTEESKIGSSRVVGESGKKNADVVEPESGENESEEKVGSVPKSDKKVDNGESCKDSGVSVVSTQPPLQEEEDLGRGWDEIEDLGSNDEKKDYQGESPNKAELQKRLCAAEDDEDLSWDIEDDDEPAKA